MLCWQADMFEHGNTRWLDARSDRNFISRLGGRIYCVCTCGMVLCGQPDNGTRFMRWFALTSVRLFIT